MGVQAVVQPLSLPGHLRSLPLRASPTDGPCLNSSFVLIELKTGTISSSKQDFLALELLSFLVLSSHCVCFGWKKVEKSKLKLSQFLNIFLEKGYLFEVKKKANVSTDSLE